MQSDSAPEDQTALAAPPRKRGARFWVILGAIVVVVAVVGTAVVILVNVITAKSELEAALPLASKLESAISHGDDVASAKLASQYGRST